MARVAENRNVPIAYTSEPPRLLLSDIRLVLKCLPSAAGILRPLNLFHLDIRDELYLGDWRNIFMVTLHIVLFIAQSAFLLSLPLVAFFPTIWFAVYVVAFIVINRGLCFVFLNRGTRQLESKVHVKNEEKYEKECWIYLNGVSVG